MTKRPGWALFTFVVESGDVVLAWTRTQSRPALVVPFKCMRETPLIISYYYNSSERDRECLMYLTPKLKAGARPLVDSLLFLPKKDTRKSVSRRLQLYSSFPSSLYA